MQMLASTRPADAAAFRAAFDGEATLRMEAGLTLLQMWREADDPAALRLLFEVNDRRMAEAWAARAHGPGAPFETVFLEFA